MPIPSPKEIGIRRRIKRWRRSPVLIPQACTYGTHILTRNGPRYRARPRARVRYPAVRHGATLELVDLALEELGDRGSHALILSHEHAAMLLGCCPRTAESASAEAERLGLLGRIPRFRKREHDGLHELAYAYVLGPELLWQLERLGSAPGRAQRRLAQEVARLRAQAAARRQAQMAKAATRDLRSHPEEATEEARSVAARARWRLPVKESPAAMSSKAPAAPLERDGSQIGPEAAAPDRPPIAPGRPVVKRETPPGSSGTPESFGALLARISRRFCTADGGGAIGG